MAVCLRQTLRRPKADLSEANPPEQPVPRRAWGSVSIILTLTLGLLIAAMLLTMALVMFLR